MSEREDQKREGSRWGANVGEREECKAGHEGTLGELGDVGKVRMVWTEASVRRVLE